MEKKTYMKPTAKVVELDTESLLAESQEPTDQEPSGYDINYNDPDIVPTVRNSIWDR